MGEVKHDGGPAFPSLVSYDHDGYPSQDANGMSLRDYFAVHADQPGYAEIVSHAGLTYGSNQVWNDADTSIGTFDSWWRGLTNSERFRLSAEVRYAMADALLRARAESLHLSTEGEEG